MQKTIILIIAILVSCNYKPNSLGAINDIVVISSINDKIITKPVVEEMFSHSVYTPQAENKYNIIWADLAELDHYTSYSNLLLISVEQSLDSTVDVLYNKIAKSYSINNELFVANNVFANMQTLMCIRIFDSIHLEEIFINNNDWILDQFNLSIENSVRAGLSSKDRNLDIERLIEQRYSLKGFIGEDYTIVKNDTINNFLWIGRGYPYRWLTINKSQHIQVFDSESMWKVLVDLYKINMPDIVISNKFRHASIEKNANNIPIKCLRGLYEHNPSDTGGPFVSYIINDTIDNKFIFLSGFVNYPENKKYNLIKQLEVILKDLTL